jgi:hypothetical protein
MNNGAYGLPSAFNIQAPHALIMEQETTLGWTTITTGGQGTGYGAAIYKALAPSASSSSNQFVAGATFQVIFPHGGSTSVKMGLRADGIWGVGGGTYGSWRMYVNLPTGDFTAVGNVTAYSDPRLKEDFKPIDDPLRILGQIVGGTFFWRSGIAHTSVKSGRRDYGVLADAVEAVMPEIVSESIEIAGERYKTVAYDKLVPVLIEAVKALAAKVEALEARHA